MPSESVEARLPSELLSEIFFHLVALDPPRENDPWEPPMYRHQRFGWLKVLHVCRRWRKIALENRCLWGNIIYVLGPKWTKFSMEIAGSLMPVSFCQTPSVVGRNSQAVAAEHEYVSRHIGHIAQLQLLLRGDEFFTVLDSLVGSPAPLLHTLKLYLYSSDGQSFVLPRDIFKTQTPKLRCLCLSSIDLNWAQSMHMLRNLTTLELQYTESVIARFFFIRSPSLT